MTKIFFLSAVIFSSFCFSTRSFAMAQKPLSVSQDAQDDEASAVHPVQSVQSHSASVRENQPVVMSQYDHLDPQHIVPTTPLANAVKYFDQHKSKIHNQRYITVIDMSQHSSHKRMYVINMQTGAVATYLAAHGRNSDPNDTGYATKFSNENGSRMTSLGFYLTGSRYSGSHGTSMYLQGLESTNNNAMERAIVMHGADYVNPSHTGRSWGCPAVEPRYIAGLVNQLEDGSLLYIWKK